MARRPTTAEILAAARAAGPRSTPAAVPSTSDAVSTATLEPAETPALEAQVSALSLTDDQAEAEGSSASDRDSVTAPPSIGSILRDVKGEREAPTAAAVNPPSMAGLLAQVRGVQAVTRPVPPSMAEILADVRRTLGTEPATPVAPVAAAAPAAKSATTTPKRRPSTAEILAAARKQASGDATEPPSAPVSSAAPASKTSSILAAARRQGAPGTAPAKPATAADALRPKPAPASPAKPAQPDQIPSGRTSDAPRPKSMTDVLAGVRTGVAERSASVDETPLPSLSEMMAALRQLDQRRSQPHHASEPVGAGRTGRLSRFRKWWSSRFGTHHGASI